MSLVIKAKHFLSRDGKGKIRYHGIWVDSQRLDDDSLAYIIKGQTGLLNGKWVPRPDITITKGKAKRTLFEQAKLQFDSECNKILDKGYKTIEELGIEQVEFEFINFGDASDQEFHEYIEKIDNFVPKIVTDQKGARKPMLAKSYKDLNKDKEFYNRYFFASAKLDGVRCFIYKDENGNLVTSSRGGKEYNIPATYILNDLYVKDLFDTYPDLVLDGELYIHGRPLSYISGLCRRQELCEGHKELKFYCYDYLKEDEIFSTRRDFLYFMRPFILDSEKIEIVDQIPICGWDNIIALHDKFVNEGYEGLVIRDPEGKYKCGARDTRMIKIKMFEDAEFLITGYEEGLRDEDFVFTLVTKEGYPFKAKPMGDRKMKDWYRNNLNECIGKMGTVKYFHYTSTDQPVPCLPVFKCVRDIKDMDL